MSAKGAAAISLAAVLVSAAPAAGSTSAAAAPHATKVLEVDASFAGTDGFNAHGNKPPAVGQGVVVEGSLYGLAGHKRGRRTGPVHIVCTFTDATGASVCTAVLALPAGKLVVSGLTPGNSPKAYTLPVLGGSGRYARAKGHIQINPIGNSNEAIDTIFITS